MSTPSPVVAIIGKGGVGKTTVTALLLAQLLRAGRTPVLAIDADPSACLGKALGCDVDVTIGSLRDRLRSDEGRPESLSKSQWLALVAEEAICEQQRFDLLIMGHPEGRGCYCFVNNLVGDYLERLSANYRAVLVDCEAGQEHLSRRTAREPSRLVCVVNRSRMAAETIARSLALYSELHEGRMPALDLVLNRFSAKEPLAATFSEIAAGEGRFRFDGVYRVPDDPLVAAAEAAGQPLSSLPLESEALASLAGWEATL